MFSVTTEPIFFHYKSIQIKLPLCLTKQSPAVLKERYQL